MKEPIPIQQWLPAGPLRDMGEKYVSQLPDVAQNPIGPESLMHQSDHSWPGVRHAQSVPPCPELDRIFQAAHRGSSLRMEKA